MAMIRGGDDGVDRERGRMRSCAGALCAALLFSLPVWALHWPWQHSGPAAPQPVLAVAVTLDSPTATQNGRSPVVQFWHGNALLLDLTRLTSPGSATVAPFANVGWPVRLEFRVRPGSLGRLDVQGAQREVFFVPARGVAQVLRVDPDVYATDTARIMLHWSAADGSGP